MSKVIWLLITSIIATAVGGGVGAMLYLFFPSPLMSHLSVLAGVLTGVATAIAIAAKREQ